MFFLLPPKARRSRPHSKSPRRPPPEAAISSRLGTPVAAASPDGLLQALQQTLQQAAEQAVASAATTRLASAVNHAAEAIENFGHSRIRQLEERLVQLPRGVRDLGSRGVPLPPQGGYRASRGTAARPRRRRFCKRAPSKRTAISPKESARRPTRPHRGLTSKPPACRRNTSRDSPSRRGPPPAKCARGLTPLPRRSQQAQEKIRDRDGAGHAAKPSNASSR